MSNRALRSRVVELEGDSDMSGVHEEDLVSVEKMSVPEKCIVNLGQNVVQISQNQETVSTELEKRTCDVSVREQSSVDVPPTNPVAMYNSSQAMFDSMAARKIATFQESFKKLICELREDIRQNNQKLLKKFESDKIVPMFAELDDELGQQTKDTSCIADELTSNIIENKEQVTEQTAELPEEINAVKGNFDKNEEIFQKGQGERLEQVMHVVERERSVNKPNFDELNSAISNTKGKLPVSPRVATSVETLQPSESSFVPFTLTVNVSDDCAISNNENGGFACSDNHVSSNVCTNGGVSDQNVPMSVRPHSANRYFSQTDFSLPRFHDSSQVNAMFRLNQLDEFMRFRGVQIGRAHV
jgi:hypothetical protein